MPRRVLILANEFIADAEHTLPEHVRRQADETHQVLVIAPVLTSWLQSLASDIDKGRDAAEHRLGRIAADISKRQHAPRTEIGDENQLLAVADALTSFAADACVVVTHDRHSQNYHEYGIAERIHVRFKLPTTALIVDLEGHLVGHETM